MESFIHSGHGELKWGDDRAQRKIRVMTFVWGPLAGDSVSPVEWVLRFCSWVIPLENTLPQLSQ